jgi:hypothetical protein
MIGRRFVTAAVLLLLGMSTGCCWWAERHCPASAGVACQAPAAPACGCYPSPAYYPPQQPVVAAQPVNWAQPRALTGCTCTCPP